MSLYINRMESTINMEMRDLLGGNFGVYPRFHSTMIYILAYKSSFVIKNEPKSRGSTYMLVQKCIEVNGHQIPDFKLNLGG